MYLLTPHSEPATYITRLGEKVTVYENKITVEFKSGVMVDVDK